MKRKILFKGTLGKMRKNVCYKYAMNEVLDMMDRFEGSQPEVAWFDLKEEIKSLLQDSLHKAK